MKNIKILSAILAAITLIGSSFIKDIDSTIHGVQFTFKDNTGYYLESPIKNVETSNNGMLITFNDDTGYYIGK